MGRMTSMMEHKKCLKRHETTNQLTLSKNLIYHQIVGLTHQKTWSGRMLRKNIWNISYLVSPVLGSGPKQWNDRSNSEMVLVILPMKRNHVCSMEKHNINRHFIIQLIIQYTTAYFLLKRKNMCSHPLSGLQRALWNRNW